MTRGSFINAMLMRHLAAGGKVLFTTSEISAEDFFARARRSGLTGIGEPGSVTGQEETKMEMKPLNVKWDWSLYLPKGVLPNTGPKDFKVGEVWASYCPGGPPRGTMKKLIECLQIFAKYAEHEWPTHCEHDVLCVVGIEKDALSAEDKAKVEELGGFRWSTEYDSWVSTRFGSA